MGLTPVNASKIPVSTDPVDHGRREGQLRGEGDGGQTAEIGAMDVPIIAFRTPPVFLGAWREIAQIGIMPEFANQMPLELADAIAKLRFRIIPIGRKMLDLGG